MEKIGSIQQVEMKLMNSPLNPKKSTISNETGGTRDVDDKRSTSALQKWADAN